MEEFLNEYGYFALALGTFLEGETAILVASALVYSGVFDAIPTVGFAFFGSFVSDWIYFFIGRINGTLFIDRRPTLKQKLEPVRAFFEAHRIQILFSYRFLYGFRTILPILIGIAGIRPLHFLGYSVAAGLLWASLVSTVGYFAGALFELTPSYFEENGLLVMAGFGTFGLILGLLIRWFAGQRMKLPPAGAH
ncbi:MAG: DedA family protein [Cyclobacteriaceae bacterium]|nr:DedA family protein [Cyclobacteriaceae bacterium]